MQLRSTRKKCAVKSHFTHLQHQGRNEVRWRPGQETSLAPPCSNLRSFGSKSTVSKKVVVTFLGLFGASRNHLAPPQWFGARGIVPPCPLSLRPCATFQLPIKIQQQSWTKCINIGKERKQEAICVKCVQHLWETIVKYRTYPNKARVLKSTTCLETAGWRYFVTMSVRMLMIIHWTKSVKYDAT